jgi:hypothetical protein
MVTWAWRRRGLLIPAPTPQPWAVSHAALPTVHERGNGLFDVYYSPRDAAGRAHVARARVLADGETLTVVSFDDSPMLEPGPLGTFDESGVTVSCIVSTDQHTLLYYTGWTLGVTVPFYFYGGLAMRARDSDGPFDRVSPAPVLERSPIDPFLTASPWVMRDDGRWRMWYISSPGWLEIDGAPRHLYHVRYAESHDGLSWQPTGRVCVDFAAPDEYAMGRPCVVKERGVYRMWFAARGDAYRLAYAESEDGLTWARRDEKGGLPLADRGWDAEMIAYPIVFTYGDGRYLLYNGNGYGRTGIGYAVCEAKP